MKIEKVTVNDAAELLTIYGPYVEETAISFETAVPSLQEFQTRIQNISGKFPYIKAVDEDGSILGYAYAATFKGRAAYDWSVETTIYIRKNSRRCGTGRKLYEALEKSLKGMGILNLNACIAVPAGDDPYLTMDSVYFHEKLGYKQVGTFHNSGNKFNRWYDMCWMEKFVGKHENSPAPVKFGSWSI